MWQYSRTPFERPPWQEASPSGEATWQCKSKNKCIDFYPWWEATPLERPPFWFNRGGLTRGVPLYSVMCHFVGNFSLFHSHMEIISWLFFLFSQKIFIHCCPQPDLHPQQWADNTAIIVGFHLQIVRVWFPTDPAQLHATQKFLGG